MKNKQIPIVDCLTSLEVVFWSPSSRCVSATSYDLFGFWACELRHAAHRAYSVRYWMGSIVPGSMVRRREIDLMDIESWESRRVILLWRGPVSTSSAYCTLPVNFGSESVSIARNYSEEREKRISSWARARDRYIWSQNKAQELWRYAVKCQ